ncbi:MAG: NAD(P)-dependent alcohol dehydrogenase [Acidimicrobiia bacterium]|nr:MAG: NAD(P)-dependent alcohol dehydrogenase [Acidimicrobiia bacterium]
MKAIVQHEYGSPDVLRLEDVEKPVPDDDEVLVRVRATSVNPYDWHVMRGTPHLVRMQFGLRRPKESIQGADMAGRVEAVGKEVTEFQPGDEVFSETRRSFAEYVCVREDRLARKPANVSFEQAAAVPLAGLTALQGLRDKGQVQQGDRVLVNGASGGVGTFAVQIAKSLGAHVTGVTSTKNVDMVLAIGADEVVDYTREDFTQSTDRYEVIFDTIGNHSPSANRRVMVPEGRYVAVGKSEMGDWVGPLSMLFGVLLASIVGKQKMVPLLAKADKGDLELLSGLVEDGHVTPVIDRHYELADVAEAIRYLEQGHASGKVVITM